MGIERELGRTGLRLTPFGLGVGEHAQAAHEQLGAVNWCEVPASVEGGAWREVAAELIDERVILTAKVAPVAWNRSMEDVCRRLLETTRHTHVDLWQLDSFDLERIKGGEPFNRMGRLRDQGLVRSLGVHVTNVNDAVWVMEHAPAQVVTMEGVLDDAGWAELLDAAAEMEIGVLATSGAVGGDLARARDLLERTSVAAFAWAGSAG